MTLKRYLDTPEVGKNFEKRKAGFAGADQGWLSDIRARAMDKFMAAGLPGPKVEEWKYTNLGFLARFLANENFEISKTDPDTTEIKMLFDRAYMGNIAGSVVVFVNGHFNPALSSCPDEDGVKFSIFSENPEAFRQSLAEPKQATSLNNLNRAMVTDGYYLEISAQTTMPQPIQIIHLATSGSDGRSLHTRGKISLAAGAKAKVIESFMGPDGPQYWTHMISDVDVAEKAEFCYFQFQLQGKQAIHMTEMHSTLLEKAKFNHMNLQLGAEVSRSEIMNSLSGEYAEIDLRGAYFGRVKQSQDIFTRINHDRPHCQSNQLFRGVLDAGGKSAFQGKVIVARHAQKTNADQSNKNLLLSRKAEANAKPELLIYADDVKCTHGATVGELDADQLFYLRSRGLDEAAAKELLVEAFVAEVFSNMQSGGDMEILQQRFTEKTRGWLSQEVSS